MNRIAKIFIVLITALVLTAKPSLAIPSGIPSQQCSTISAPVPGNMCYVVHENQGGKAYAKGKKRKGELLIQPQAGYFVTVEARSEVTSRVGDSQIDKSVLAKGADVEIVKEYRTKIEELDKTINDIKLKIAGSVGVVKAELENKLSYLKEVKKVLEEDYRIAVKASKEAVSVLFSWSAHPRKCGWGNLDRCGSWIRFRVYEVRRYLGDPIAEYNRLLEG